MASVSISFLIPSSSATNTDLPCFTLLGERHVDYVIADYNETFSSMTVNGNYSLIMEVFYVMKDLFIQRVDVSDSQQTEGLSHSAMSFYLPESLIPAIIGKSGIAVENLRRILYAKLSIVDDDDLIAGKSKCVLEGDENGIPQAFSMLMLRILTLTPAFAWPYEDSTAMSNITDSVLNADRMKKSDFFTRALMNALNPNAFAASGSDRDAQSRLGVGKNPMLSFMLANSRVGSIIGTSGSTIRQIREETGAHISISKPIEGVQERRVDIIGDLDNICSACKLIVQHLSERKDKE